MKTIGLIGGMSWESTASYYRIINQVIGQRLGGLHSAKILLASVDFAEIEVLQRAGQWEQCGEALARHARVLESAGADFLVLCTNTMHKVAAQIEAAVSIPLLHIAEATGVEVRAAGFTRVGLLATRFTMEQPFYRSLLAERYGLEVVVPPAPQRERLHRIIFDELCRGHVLEPSRTRCRGMIEELAGDGCEAVILGCTELGLLVQPSDTTLPLFDTTELHATKAALDALGDGSALDSDH